MLKAGAIEPSTGLMSTKSSSLKSWAKMYHSAPIRTVTMALMSFHGLRSEMTVTVAFIGSMRTRKPSRGDEPRGDVYMPRPGPDGTQARDSQSSVATPSAVIGRPMSTNSSVSNE